MKAKKNRIFSIITGCLYAAALITYITLLAVEYGNGQKNAAKTYSMVTSAVTTILRNSEPDTYAFVEEANNSTVLHNLIDNPTNLAGLQMTVGDELIFSSPAEVAKFPSTKSSLVKFYTTSVTSEKGVVVKLKIALYLLKPSSIYNYGRITFLVILILTLITGLLLFIGSFNQEELEEEPEIDTPESDIELPEFESEINIPLVTPDEVSANYDDTINEAGTIIEEQLDKELETAAVSAEAGEYETVTLKSEPEIMEQPFEEPEAEQVIVEYKDDRPSRDELFSDQDIQAVTGMFDDDFLDNIEEYVPESTPAPVSNTDNSEEPLSSASFADSINFAKTEFISSEENTGSLNTEIESAFNDTIDVPFIVNTEITEVADNSESFENADSEVSIDTTFTENDNTTNPEQIVEPETTAETVSQETDENHFPKFEIITEGFSETSTAAETPVSDENNFDSEYSGSAPEASPEESPETAPQTEPEAAQPVPAAEETKQPEPASNGLFSPLTNFGWESFMLPRLDSELVRAASTEQDLSLFAIKIKDLSRASEVSKLICQRILEVVKFQDLVFEMGEDGCTAIFAGLNVDESLEIAEDLHTSILSILAQNGNPAKAAIGISSKSARLISGERLYNEAKQALDYAMEDAESPIVAFRVNPEKYRNYLSSEAAKIKE